MYAITHFDRGRLVTELRYTAAEKNKPVRKMLRKVFTQDNILCVLTAGVFVLVLISNI